MEKSDKPMMEMEPRNGFEKKDITSDTNESGKLSPIATFFEVLVLTCVMVVIVGLCCIPTIYYADNELQSDDETSPMNSSLMNSSQPAEGPDLSMACVEMEPYTGSVCTDLLTSLQTCYSGVTSPPTGLNIPSALVPDQAAAEQSAMTLLGGLPFFMPTPECAAAITPFICLANFPLCDADDQVHIILREACLELRDDICAPQWAAALDRLGASALPVCEALPDLSEECVAPPVVQNASTLALNCSEGLHFDEEIGVCRPTCGEFFPTPLAIQVILDIVVVLGLIASVIVLVLALSVHRKSLLVFPTILYVYGCITAFVIGFLIFVGIVANTEVFCEARAVIPGSEGTGFCTLTGVVYIYALSLFCLWGLLHAIFLFWSLIHSSSYEAFLSSPLVHVVHIISVVVAMVIPLPAALLHFDDGHVSVMTPTYTCIGRDTDRTYYSFVLPFSIVLAVTACLLVYSLWTTLLRRYVFKEMENFGCRIAVIMVVIHYVILCVFGLASYTWYYLKGPGISDEFTQYVACESAGNTADCEIESYDSAVNRVLILLTILMMALLPIIAAIVSTVVFICKKKSGEKNYRA